MKPLEELLEIAKSAKERADKATEGPWFVDGLGTDKAELKNNADLRIYVFNPRGFKSLQSTDLTAFFIASARTDVPRLADAVIDLITQLKDAQGEIEEMKNEVRAAKIENNSWEERCSKASHYTWLDDRNQQLEQRLTECESVVKFYSSRENLDLKDVGHEEDNNNFGHTARQYLSKWSVE